MNIKKWQKFFLISYVIFLIACYAAIFFEVESVIEYLDTLDVMGFVLVLPVMWSGIQKQLPHRRSAWKIFFIASVFFCIGDLTWAYYTNYLGVEAESPSICDFFYMSNTVIYFIGLIVYVKNIQTMNFMAVSFDMLISIFAAGGIIYNFMIAPTLENRPAEFFQTFSMFFYPVIDFALMAGIIILIFGTDDRGIFNRENITLAWAFIIMFVLDESSLVANLYDIDFGNWLDVAWSLPCFFIALSSLHPTNDTIPKTRFFNFTTRIERTLLYSRMLIPYFYTFMLLILIGAKYNLFDAVFLWAICLIILISVRQILVIERNKNLLRTIRKNEEKLNLQNLELQRLNQQILRDAEVDFLTQLSNRRYIDKTFERLMPPEGRAESLGILLIDVDFFKRINDTYGHPTGDFVLQEVANKIKSVIRGGDVAGRFGGDEFIILLPESDLQIVKTVAEQLTNAVRADKNLAEKKVTLSIGGTSQRVNHENYNVQNLLKQSDESLYKAKEGGRNCFVVE